MTLKTRQLLNTPERKVWTVHDGKEHIGFLEQVGGAWQASIPEGLKRYALGRDLALTWLVEQAEGESNANAKKGRDVVRKRAVSRKRSVRSRKNKARGLAKACRLAQ